MPKRIKSILVYTGGDLVGDAVLKLPFLHGLRKYYTKAKITWFAGQSPSAFKTSLAPMVVDLLDEVISPDSFVSPFTELRKKIGKRCHYDLIIDTQKGVLTTLMLKRIHHKTFVSPALRFLLSDIKPKRPTPKNLQGQLLHLLEVATNQAPQNQDFRLKVPLTLQKDAAGILPFGSPHIGLAPGAGGGHKQWPLENFVTLAKELKKLGLQPVFFLGPNEVALHANLQEQVPEALFPLQDASYSHGFDIPFVVALAQRCALNISNDAGIGHICALSGRPQLILFGPTSPEKFQPITGSTHALRAQDFGGTTMADLPIDAVLERAKALYSPPTFSYEKNESVAGFGP